MSLILQKLQPEHQLEIDGWNDTVPLEIQTCRPISDSKVVPSCKKRTNFVFLLPNNQIAGRLSYSDHNTRNRSVEIGYLVNPQLRNQGIGTQMLRLAITHLFENLNLNKIYCQTAEFNLPSIKILEKLGFHKDAVLREHHELGGKLFDDYIFSLLRREWIK